MLNCYVFHGEKTIILCIFWTIFNEYMNIGNTFIFIPVIREFVRSLYKLYDDIEDDIISDISASLFNNAYFLGNLLGPIRKLIKNKYKSRRNIDSGSRIS